MTHRLGSSCRVYQGQGEMRVIRPISEGDHAEATVGPTPSIAQHIPVTSIMTREVVCARRDLDIDKLVPLIVRNHIGCMPVVDERGKPIGMITKLDLVERIAYVPERQTPPKVAEDVMMPLAITLNQRATVAHAAAMMSLEDVHHIPVIAASGVVIGIVSSLDIVRWLARNDGMTSGHEATAGWTDPE